MSGDPDDADEAREGFLSRWSRRKRAVAAEAPAPVLPTPAPVTPEPDDRPRDPETGEPIDTDWVATLPDVASLKPGDDLSAFMRRGVPEALRRQALRTLWTTDPAIRDYVSPALDYAYDYNTPGGAPGYGVLSETEVAEARGFVEKLFSAPRAAPETASAESSPNESGNTPHQGEQAVAEAGAEALPADAAAQHLGDSHPAPATAPSAPPLQNTARNAMQDRDPPPEMVEIAPGSLGADHAALRRETAPPPPATPPRRRGGRATPV
jgi:hypothetical protein